MRFAPALVLFSLAVSTASVTGPAAADGVTPRVMQIGLDPADLVGDVLSAARSTRSFSMLGLTWSGAGDLPLSVRTHTGGVWTDWQHLERDDDGPDAGPEDNVGQAATAPLWVGPSDAFQVRLDGPTALPLPTRLNLALIDPGNSPHDSATVQPAVVDRGVTARDLPPIGTRKDWNANERMRHRAPRYTGGIQVAFVHHTAGGNRYSESDVPKIIRGVYAFHTRVRGWSDDGQAPGLDPQSDATLVSAGGGTDRWRRGRTVTFLRISGHRDAGSTECPGTFLYADLNEIRQRVWYLQHTGQVAKPGTRPAPFPDGTETGRMLLEHLFQPPKSDDPSVREDWAQQRVRAGR